MRKRNERRKTLDQHEEVEGVGVKINGVVINNTRLSVLLLNSSIYLILGFKNPLVPNNLAPQ